MQFLYSALGTLVGLFVGAYLTGYLTQKGKNLATHEDIQRVLDQVRTVTAATEEIKSSISDKSWNRQRHWEMRKEAIFEVMQALGKADEALHAFSQVMDLENKYSDSKAFHLMREKSAAKLIEEIDSFDKKRALALIVCDRSMNDTLMSLKNDMRDLGSKLMEGQHVRYEDAVPKMKPKFAMAFALSRLELGIERNDGAKRASGESLAIPNEDSGATA